MEANIYNIPTANMEPLRKKLGSLNKRMMKRGVANVANIIELSKTRNVEDDGTVSIFHQIVVEGTEMKIAGWRFIARLNHNTDGTGASNLVYVMPGQTMPDTFRDATADCEHCGWTRKRRDTFVLFNDDKNEYKQIGRTCLKDFFGWNPEAMALQAELFTKFADACDNEQTPRPTSLQDHRLFDLERYLTYVAKSISEEGWVTRKQEREGYNITSTSTRALNDMLHYQGPGLDDEFSALACAAIEHGKTLDATENDFMHNLSVIANEGFIDFRSTGTAAYLVQMFLNLKKPDADPIPTAVTSNEHVGDIGERITADVRVIRTHDFEGRFGPTRVVNMLDAKGRVIVTFSTGKFRPVTGDKFMVVGTVIEHDEWNGTKQTKINRAKKIG